NISNPDKNMQPLHQETEVTAIIQCGKFMYDKLFCVFLIDRVFYETLIEQRPDSEMAQEWCLNHGILEWARAKKLYETVCKRKGRTAIAYSATAPKIKTESPVKKAAPKATPAAKKRKIIDDEVVDTGLFFSVTSTHLPRY